jgi:hypothetical protein
VQAEIGRVSHHSWRMLIMTALFTGDLFQLCRDLPHSILNR